MIRAYKDVSRAEDVPSDLADNLQQLVVYVFPSSKLAGKISMSMISTLTSIQKLAQDGVSRNFFKALFRSGIDAGKIQDYREKLKQSMRVFGVSIYYYEWRTDDTYACVCFQLQTDISLRETVAKLASQQQEIMRGIERQETRDPIGSTQSSSTLAPPGTPNALSNSAKGPIKVTSVAGDMVSNQTSKTTTAANSYNAMTNSTLNVGNKTTTAKTTANNRSS